VAVNASADPNAISQFDPNVFTLTHFGLRTLQSFSLNGSNANPTQTPKGIVFDDRALPANAPPGQPFVIGRTVGLSPTDVTATFSMPADPPGVAGQWKQLDLAFGARSAVATCCPSAWIAMKRTQRDRRLRPAATLLICSAVAC
jgi:hypothetical protein